MVICDNCLSLLIIILNPFSTTKRGKKGAGLTMEDLRMLFELS